VTFDLDISFESQEVKVVSSRSLGENVAKVVGATWSEDFQVKGYFLRLFVMNQWFLANLSVSNLFAWGCRQAIATSRAATKFTRISMNESLTIQELIRR